MKRFFILLLILSLLTFADKRSTAQGLAKTVSASSSVNKILMLQLVNAARAKGCHCGDDYYGPASPLVWNDQLEKAGLSHSMDMYKNNYFSHTENDGSTAGSRIEAAGYSWKNYGENIGMGYRDEKQVMEGWLKSPMHCKNIMNAAYKEMGVGKAGAYWTQDFASK